MKAYTLDSNALLGGIIAEDNDQQIVHLHLQKDNEMPAYQADAIITFVMLSGRARITTDEGYIDLEPLQLARLEPNEVHTVTALEDNTHLVAIKQLFHELGMSRKLRFGQCCL